MSYVSMREVTPMLVRRMCSITASIPLSLLTAVCSAIFIFNQLKASVFFKPILSI